MHRPGLSLFDEVMLDLEVKEREEKRKRATTPVIASQLTFTGYVARVRRIHCICCDTESEVLEGVFAEETHTNGTRRLTGLDQRAQMPAGSGHRLEHYEQEVARCPACIRALGFDKEVDLGPEYSLLINRDEP